jgi:hypothetical protein
MDGFKRHARYPFALWRRKGPRWFLLGYLGVIILLAFLDRVLADFEYLRQLDILVIVLYGLAWFIAYKLKPGIFD